MSWLLFTFLKDIQNYIFFSANEACTAQFLKGGWEFCFNAWLSGFRAGVIATGVIAMVVYFGYIGYIHYFGEE